MECRKFDNERAHISFMNFMRGQSKPTNVKREVIQKPQQLHLRPTPPWRMNNQNFQSRQNDERNIPRPTNQFPRDPIHLKTQPSQRHYPTNSQVFGKKPSYEPTPMSVSTRVTSNRNDVNTNHFTPQSRPTFTSKELNNLEEEEREDYQLERLSSDEDENFHEQASEDQEY
ncbi:hypothetical protein HHI36_023922 [Cryptolaemus montrouzieri]|uniref:Uncharacterized protein n=1 Tax=Cryptolaemus montrouzieri TaxID=559131 RepID=A0ABD2NY90_9CUCU